jgi:hypothetical protein
MQYLYSQWFGFFFPWCVESRTLVHFFTSHVDDDEPVLYWFLCCNLIDGCLDVISDSTTTWINASWVLGLEHGLGATAIWGSWFGSQCGRYRKAGCGCQGKDGTACLGALGLGIFSPMLLAWCATHRSELKFQVMSFGTWFFFLDVNIYSLRAWSPDVQRAWGAYKVGSSVGVSFVEIWQFACTFWARVISQGFMVCSFWMKHSSCLCSNCSNPWGWYSLMWYSLTYIFTCTLFAGSLHNPALQYHWF